MLALGQALQEGRLREMVAHVDDMKRDLDFMPVRPMPTDYVKVLEGGQLTGLGTALKVRVVEDDDNTWVDTIMNLYSMSMARSVSDLVFVIKAAIVGSPMSLRLLCIRDPKHLAYMRTKSVATLELS
jgi:hypothetical protein